MVAEVTQCATPSSPTPSSSSDNSFIESALEGMIAQEIESERIMHKDEDEARGGDGSIKGTQSRLPYTTPLTVY